MAGISTPDFAPKFVAALPEQFRRVGEVDQWGAVSPPAMPANLGTLAAKGIRVRPGLVASAEIKTGKRSIAAYVLDPILRTTDESLREP